MPLRLPHIILNDGTALLRLRRRYPKAEQWGLYAFADPSIPARQAPVFWCRAALRHVIRVGAERSGRHQDPLTLSSFHAERTASIDVDGTLLVLMKGQGHHIPLEIHGLTVPTSPFAPLFEIDGLKDLGAQTDSLKRLQRFTEPAANGASRASFGIDERLHHALIALDESLSGKTYRQIAIKIFGEKRVAEEWLGPSQFLKDRTRRLVAKGRELMLGGYRDLLS